MSSRSRPLCSECYLSLLPLPKQAHPLHAGRFGPFTCRLPCPLLQRETLLCQSAAPATQALSGSSSRDSESAFSKDKAPPTKGREESIEILIRQLWLDAKRSNHALDAAYISDVADRLGTTPHLSDTSAFVVQLLWALALQKHGVSHAFCDVLALLLHRLEAAGRNARNQENRGPISGPSAAAALEATARLGLRDDRIIDSIVSLIEFQAAFLNPRSTVRVINALATLQLSPRTLLPLLAPHLRAPGFFAALRPKDIGMLSQSMAALDWIPSREALSSLADAVFVSHRGLRPHDVSCTLWMISRRGAATEKLLLKFEPAVHNILPTCSMGELADISRAYAIAGVAHVALFEAIAKRAACCVDGARLEDVSRVVSSFHQLNLQPEYLLEVVEAWADRRLQGLSAKALSLALANFARLGNRTPRLLKTAASCAESKAPDMEPTEIARVIWAFARLDHAPGRGLLDPGVDALRTHIRVFIDRDAANLLWALARLGRIPSSQELEDIARGLEEVAYSYSGQSAALVLWALATFVSAGAALPVRQTHKSLLQDLAGSVARDVHALDPQSISMTAWALGTLRVRDSRFPDAVAMECAADGNRFVGFETQHLANLAWGMVKSGNSPDKELMQRIEDAAAPRLSEFSPQELFNICWAFATLRLHSMRIGELAAAELEARSSEFGPLELSGMLWALGRLLLPAGGGGGDDINITACAAEAILSTLRVANREVPVRASAMEASQIGMALFGLGRLVASTSSSTPVTIQEAVQALDHALRNHLADRNKNAVSNASLASVVEGFAWVRYSLSPELKVALSTRIAAAMTPLHVWEFCPLAYYLTQIGMEGSSRNLLESSTPPLDKELRPRGAVLLLAAMRECNRYPKSVFVPVAACLSSMSAGYRLEPHLGQLLQNTKRDLPPETADLLRRRNRRRNT